MNILDTIVEQKRRELALLPEATPSLQDLTEALNRRGGARGFRAALASPRAGRENGKVALIAEVKKASPSAGVIRPDFDPVQIARTYAAAGADCLSVLTDEKFFQGSLRFLRDIREAVSLPLLRKDFVIDARQILEAIQWGADAVLLIAAILDDDTLVRLHELAIGCGLDALVEVHDAAELARVQRIGATLIGVNNRDLKTFKVDLATTESLAATVDLSQTLLVAESGIKNRGDVTRLARCGAGAILVGESLMRGANIGDKVAELLGLSQGSQLAPAATPSER